MPSGGQKALDNETMNKVWQCFKQAETYGLTHEWMQWFIGGLVEDGKLDNDSVVDHANRACIEWDF